ncbi:hypothetical protein SLEP1_g46774 [Rubroshorea leprosula]|uniref:Uncharacterized protein n=1 Tax=Rubroshorea leprosula TaxID=152421 RepID=A0AAV5LQF0_9ROSI|nr:hypothetical protein SLEP1_g46774 [Rubroshorea leprosula]
MDSLLYYAITFVSKIRSRVPNEIYKAFLQGFANLRKGIWELDDLDREVILLFEDHPDLIEEFQSFRTDCQSFSGVVDYQLKQSWIPIIQQHYSFEVENSLRKYPNGFAEEFHKLMRNPSSKSESESEKSKKKRKGSHQVEAESEKSMKKKRCTPCYEFRRDYDPKAADSDSETVVATPLESEDSDPRKVLNSTLVCVQHRKYSSRPPRLQTPQEKVLNEIEDDLFQLDMTLAWFGSAAENIEKILKEKRVEGIDIRERLTAMNLRCIENLYEQCPDILESLYENPVVGLPVLSKQLRRKEEELREMKEEKMKKIHGAFEEKKEELKRLHSCSLC